MRSMFLRSCWTVCVCGVLLSLAATSWAEDADSVGTIGMRHTFAIDGVFGHGSRIQNYKTKARDSGNQYVVRAEGGAFFLSTPLGNMGGIEGGAEMGADGIPYQEKDNLMGGMGFLADLWVGFPVTLLNLNKKGSPDWLRIAFTPGMGTSMVSAYTYVKLRGAWRVTDGLTGELSYVWWPGSASYPYGSGNNRSVNEASLRASVLFGDTGGKGGALHAYLEVFNGQREDESNNPAGSKKLFGGAVPFPPVARFDYESLWRVGIGYAF